MIEFVTESGARYRVTGEDGRLSVVTDEVYGITRAIWRIQGGGFEMLYGGHWIEGKLRVKAGRRVIPTEIEIYSRTLFKFAQDVMDSNSFVWWGDRRMRVTSCRETPNFQLFVSLVPWEEKENG